MNLFSKLLIPGMAIIFCLLFVQPSAAGIQPGDFARGMPIELTGGNAVYRMSLPLEVYETTTRNDMGDIRVFNGAGTVVPHVIRRPENNRFEKEVKTPLPFFPLYRDVDHSGKKDLTMRIEKGEDGTIINVAYDETAAAKRSEPTGYLIDSSRYDQPLHTLAVDWEDDRTSVIVNAAVVSSNDLTQWSTVVGQSSLVQMQFSGYSILKNRIQLPAVDARYFRLSWPPESRGIRVKNIYAVWQGEKPEQERMWIPLEDGRQTDADGQKTRVYEYVSPGIFPVDRLRLDFDEPNTLVKATVFSRSNPEENWHERKSSLFYNLHFDQTILIQDTVAFEPEAHRYWRIAFHGALPGKTEDIPFIEMGWIPHELLFVARGEGPFVMAYGSASLPEYELKHNDGQLLAGMIAGEKDIPIQNAFLLPEITLGGPDRLIAEPPPLAWRTWLLWAVLVIGVGIVAWMAFSLVKGMQKETCRQGSDQDNTLT